METFCRWQSWLAPAFLLAMSYLLFANTFGNVWTYDDYPVIVENLDVRSWAEFLKNSYPGRPLRELTYLFDYQLFGLNPAGWHIQNIFWHGLNAGLLWILLVGVGASRRIAWIAALFFLAHPLQVEVVANISHRKDSLALAFILLATLAYHRALTTDILKKPLLLIFSAVCYALGCLAKEVVILLPVMFMALEAGFVPRENRLLLRHPKIWVVLLSIGSACLLIWFLWFGGLERFSGGTASHLSKFNYFAPVTPIVYYATVLASFCRMMFRVVWPVDLAAEYVFPVPDSLIDSWALGGLTLLVLMTIGLLVFRRRDPLVFLGLAWGLLFWLPVSNFWPIAYLAADRYWYLPLAGFSVIAAKVIDGLLGERRFWQLFAVASILTLMVTLTWNQSKVWQSRESLWTQAVAVSPNSPFALNNLGACYYIKGDLAGAEKIFERSFSVNPKNPTSIFNLALIAEKAGDHKKALRYYQLFLVRAGGAYQKDIDFVRQHLSQNYGVNMR